MEGVIDKIFKKIKELDYVNFGNETEIIYAKSICFKILALIEELQFDNQRGKQIEKIKEPQGE